MRKFLIAVVAALTALAVVAVAQAQSPGADITVSISPNKVGTKKKPKAEKLTLELKNEDSSQTADGLEVFVAKNIKASTKGLRKCSAARLEAEGKSACPAASKVGSGTADAIAGVNTGAPAALKFNVTAFIIGNNKIGFYLEQQGGEIRVMATGTFKRASGQYGSVLDVDIPQLAREFPPGTFNGLVGLKTTLYKKVGKNSLLVSNGCPNTRQLPFKVVIHFMNNPNPPKAAEVEATGTANCRK